MADARGRACERLAGRRMTDAGIIVIDAQRLRSLEQNRADATGRLATMIQQALVEPKPRKKTRPTRASKERRLQGEGARFEGEETAPAGRSRLTDEITSDGMSRYRPSSSLSTTGCGNKGRSVTRALSLTVAPRHRFKRALHGPVGLSRRRLGPRSTAATSACSGRSAGA